MAIAHEFLSQSPLCSPIGTFNEIDEFNNYPVLFKLYKKLSNCGVSSLIFLNKESGEQIDIPAYCDNRVCVSPACQKHRLYKYMKEHRHQINDIGKDMRKPKAWVFTTARRSYPIDRSFCRSRVKQLYSLLSKARHPRYGSNSKFSVHMEIKPDVDSWYLHFHVVSGGITDLRFVRKLWGFVIKYEMAISPVYLARYVSKYASKTPNFPNKLSFFEYAQAVYKLQMHRFSTKIQQPRVDSIWILLEIKHGSGCASFGEMLEFFDEYIDGFG